LKTTSSGTEGIETTAETEERLTPRGTKEEIYVVVAPLFGILVFRGKQIQPRAEESRRQAIRRYRRSLKELGALTKRLWRGWEGVQKVRRARRAEP